MRLNGNSVLWYFLSVQHVLTSSAAAAVALKETSAQSVYCDDCIAWNSRIVNSQRADGSEGFIYFGPDERVGRKSTLKER